MFLLICRLLIESRKRVVIRMVLIKGFLKLFLSRSIILYFFFVHSDMSITVHVDALYYE
jgi:hypothetical protein